MLLMAALLVAPATFAQRGGFGNFPQYRYDNIQYDNSVLSIFSENGEQFFLILNGMKQNLVPTSKIRVEALPKFQNDVQIVFVNNSAPPIRRMVNIVDPIDGRAVNLTLRISRGGRGGGARLRFHRMSECDRGYRGPRDEYVMYYGRPQQINTVSETTYMDPITGQWITETTTTTTDNVYGGGFNNDGFNNNNFNNNGNFGNNNGFGNNGFGGGRGGGGMTPPMPQGPMPMDSRSFGDAKQSIASSSFEDTKLSTAKTILSTANNFMSTGQIMEICQLFSFENTKVNFAKFAYGRCSDPQNYFKVGSVFSFDANRKALNDFITNGGR